MAHRHDYLTEMAAPIGYVLSSSTSDDDDDDDRDDKRLLNPDDEDNECDDFCCDMDGVCEHMHWESMFISFRCTICNFLCEFPPFYDTLV